MAAVAQTHPDGGLEAPALRLVSATPELVEQKLRWESASAFAWAAPESAWVRAHGNLKGWFRPVRCWLGQKSIGRRRRLGRSIE